MKKITATTSISCIKILRNIILSTLVLITVIFIFGQMAQAQNDPGIAVKQYLIAKHNLREDDVISILEQTPDGLKGYLSIKGEIKSQNIPIAGNVEERARAVAKAFLKDESSLFGITNMDEIREMGTYSGEGSDGAYRNINYLRYIENWELRGAYINIKIGHDENIISAEAYLVPAPPELYRAVTGKTLAEAEIRKIIEDDMKANAESPETTSTVKAMIADFDPKLMRLGKFLIPKPPYVIYQAHTVWGYTIDALTGEILEKVPVGYITNEQVPHTINTININLKQDASSRDATMPTKTISASPKEPVGIKKETEKITSHSHVSGKKMQINTINKPLPTRSLNKQDAIGKEIPTGSISKEPDQKK